MASVEYPLASWHSKKVSLGDATLDSKLLKTIFCSVDKGTLGACTNGETLHGESFLSGSGLEAQPFICLLDLFWFYVLVTERPLEKKTKMLWIMILTYKSIRGLYI